MKTKEENIDIAAGKYSNNPFTVMAFITGAKSKESFEYWKESDEFKEIIRNYVKKFHKEMTSGYSIWLDEFDEWFYQNNINEDENNY